MQSHVNALKSNLGSYSRAYMFAVTFLVIPGGINLTGNENKAVYLVRSTNLPENTIEPIVVSWQGQEAKIGSTHTFADWSCTFNVDLNAEIRKEFLKWQKNVHDPETNAHGAPIEYYGEIKIDQLDVNNNVVFTQVLHDAWPTTVGAVELAQDSKELSQFDVTFVYNWESYA